jgi:5'-nucleotidase/UDP-sugar diphosphatase
MTAVHAKGTNFVPESMPMLSIRRSFLALLLLLALAAPAFAQSVTAKVTFVLVNDIYQLGEQAMYDGRARGGFARLAAVVKAERARNNHVIFAHAGDTLSPSLLSSIDRGAHIVALTNLLRPDIFVPGNHEYDFGKETFLQRMAEARFPLFAANLRDASGAPLAGFSDRAIVEVDGIRIGLTGATADDSHVKSSPGDLRFAPTVDTVREQASMLRREGADFVVAVVHSDRQKDEALFRSRAADLILSGDDHDLYINYDRRTAIVESSSDADYVTAIDVSITATMREGRREVAWWPNFRVIDTADIVPDPDVAAVVAQYEKRLASELDQPIATTAVELDSRASALRTQETAIGNLFADALRAQTGADVALTNGGGIRAEKIYPPGSRITRRDILAELVFGNTIALLSIDGKALKNAVENGLSLMPRAAGRFPQISGMTIEADISRPIGQRVTAIRVGGAPLDETKSYTLATNDFLARGGDSYTDFRDARPLMRDYDAPLMANVVIDYLLKIGTVESRIEGRTSLK